jgi:hypothetical protein
MQRLFRIVAALGAVTLLAVAHAGPALAQFGGAAGAPPGLGGFSGAFSPRGWPLVANETFTRKGGSSSEDWWTGSAPNERLARREADIVAGRYRWAFEAIAPFLSWIDAPYGPATDFYVATDVDFVDMTDGPIAAGVMFGVARGQDYEFRVTSTQRFGLFFGSDGETQTIIDYTHADFDPTRRTRLAVAATDGLFTLFINDRSVGAYREPDFSGGKFRLAVAGWTPGQSLVVDFDNFELRQRP